VEPKVAYFDHIVLISVSDI